MSPRFVLGRENVLCVAEVVNRSLKADCIALLPEDTSVDSRAGEGVMELSKKFSHPPKLLSLYGTFTKLWQSCSDPHLEIRPIAIFAFYFLNYSLAARLQDNSRQSRPQK